MLKEKVLSRSHLWQFTTEERAKKEICKQGQKSLFPCNELGLGFCCNREPTESDP